jgi:peptidoglycan/LPS O-acetylase OafA/YrhL
MTPTGVQAVDIFFVLSGFVIAHVCATRERDASAYFVSRAVRICSVAIPALILTVVLDSLGLHLNASAYEGPFQPITSRILVRCVLFINEQWNTHRFPGSNGPYWSLGFEVWYYIAFGALLFIARPWKWPVTIALLAFIGPKVALLFPLWLMGVALYHICSAPLTNRPSVGLILFTTPIVVLVLYQLFPHPSLEPFSNVTFDRERLWSFGQDYFVGALFCAHLIGFTIISASFARWLDGHSRFIRWIAGATFSVYLIHLPVMTFLAAISPLPKSSPWNPALLILVTLLTCFAFAEVSERRKDAWRQLFRGGVHRLEVYLPRLRKPE